MRDFENKIVIVTGAASGIGRALSEELTRRGAIVIATDAAFVAHASSPASAQPGCVQPSSKRYERHLDVTDAASVQAVIDQTVAQHGRLDLMINNAGIGIAAEMHDIELPDWQRIIDVNLLGVVHGTAAAYRQMVKQGHGHIVNVASIAGLIGCPTAAPYAATKAAVIGLSISLRAEAAPHGVCVTVACPGSVQTPFYDAATVRNVPRDKVWGLVPMKLIGAEQAARAILRGVARNRAIVVFPASARLAWWLHRMCPGIMARFHARLVKGFHALRIKAGE